MRSQLEAEKQEKEKAINRLNEVIGMLDQARKAYAILYHGIEITLQRLKEEEIQITPGKYPPIDEVLFSALADGELESPFEVAGAEASHAEYCRTCGRPITPTPEATAYCETCSRSVKVQVSERPKETQSMV